MEVGQSLAYGLLMNCVPIPPRRVSLLVVLGFFLFVVFKVRDGLDEEPFFGGSAPGVGCLSMA